MILDSLKNKAQYAALHPRFQTVFDFIDNNDVAALPCGRHDIDGDNIFVMVQEMDLREIKDARLELHRKYIDIQLLLRLVFHFLMGRMMLQYQYRDPTEQIHCDEWHQ